ncbi:MAG: DUF512 domain-containing protein [Oscillospiraceae bacterium]|jgi:putative radical SAM enzyme (TIGR03279 family)|nr:DUF512 domain-containing protein [Oscillospiraceae bacterium]
MKITVVSENSPAYFAGIDVGDTVLAINGHKINDVLDYKFYVATKKVKITLQDRTVKIKKEVYEDLGIEFETYLMDEKKNCHNKCIFCFIDQLPKDLRDTLYFKDDDARLSFLQGNYITLTNLTDSDVDRIIEMKLSVNVSVHTTNPQLRCKMMNNKFAGEKLEYLYSIARANIPVNCQIVLCKDWNDGAELFNSLRDLTFYKSIESIAVVPVGMTKFRESLQQIEPFDKKDAETVIECCSKFDRVYPADEFFLLAEKEIPKDEYYKDYPQYENGVGMLRYLEEEVKNRDILPFETDFSIATGVAAYDTVSRLSLDIQKRFGVKITVFKIKNNFFGERITVAGLLTAQDIIEQLQGRLQYKNLLLPSVMFNFDGLTLDDKNKSDIEKALNVEVKISEFILE